jgi:hypothetical protein
MNDPTISQGAGRAAPEACAQASCPPFFRATLLVLAATMLGIALFVNYGTFSPAAVSYLSVSLVLALAGALLPAGTGRAAWTQRAMWVTLLACFSLQIALDICHAPVESVLFMQGVQIPPSKEVVWLSWQSSLYWTVLMVAAVVCGQLASPRLPLGRFTLPLLIGLFLVAAIWVIRRDVDPFIDVFDVDTQSSGALLAGQNPYAIHFDSIYNLETTRHLYAPGDYSPDGRRLLFGYVYMPLTLLMTVPGYLLGDVRYSMIAAAALTALLMGLMRPGRMGLTAAAGLLFMPRMLNVIDFSFTEPLAVVLLTLTVFCAIRLPKLTPYALGLMLASKQDMLFALVLSPLLFGWEWRPLLTGILVAGATVLVVTLPMVLTDVAAFVHSAVLFPMHVPFRPFALSIMVLWHPGASSPPSAIFGFLALFVVTGLMLWRLRPGAANFAVAVAVSYFAFFAFNKHAFINYYFFVVAALWCSIAALDLPWRPAASESL